MAPVIDFVPRVVEYVNRRGEPRYSSKADPKDARIPDANGLPTVRLVWLADRLEIAGENDLLFAADTPGLSGFKVFGFDVRGLSHYGAADKAGDTRPGSRVDLVRQPDNEFDRNAIAVQAAGSGSTLGYVNKRKASSLAKLMDRGVPLMTVVLRGSPPGRRSDHITVIAAEPALFAHLCRQPWPEHVVDRTRPPG